MNVSKTRLVVQLKTLVDLSSAVYTSHDPAEIRHRAVQSAAILVDAERCSLLMCHPETGDLCFETRCQGLHAGVMETRLQRAEGIAGWAVENRRAAVVNDISKDPRYVPPREKFSSYRTRNMLCVPVFVRDEVVGALQAMNKIGGDFDECDRDMLEALARHISVAMENADLYVGMREAFYQTAEALADTLEKADASTGRHIRRVMDYSVLIAAELGLSAHESEDVRLVAILHDIGKIGIPHALLLKPEGLGHDEFEVIKTHCSAGSEILGKVTRFRAVAEAVGSHHERFDGTGYPMGLAGEHIPLASRVVAVADAFDAMTSDRPYRPAMSRDEAINELRACSGSQFDPAIAEAFLGLLQREAVPGSALSPVQH